MQSTKIFIVFINAINISSHKSFNCIMNETDKSKVLTFIINFTFLCVTIYYSVYYQYEY